MTFGSILALAIGVAMDAAAISAARGIAARQIRPSQAALIAGVFSGFQMAMPLAGWLLGNSVNAWVATWDHWIAFALLGAIGGKMLWDALRNKPEEHDSDEALFGLKVLLVLAVATSVDAFAVGIALPMMHAPLVLTIATIGAVTLALCLAGLYAGRRIASSLGDRFEVIGAIMLIGLAFKVLFEHLMNE